MRSLTALSFSNGFYTFFPGFALILHKANYIVRESLFYPANSRLPHTMKCACCGADMLQDKELENTIIYKCKERSLTDTRLKDTG
jgi:hypothetical protein